MAKIDLDSMSIEEVAGLRDQATDKLAEKVAARRAELEKLAQYDKPARKSPISAPIAKAKKGDEKKSDENKSAEVKEAIAKAA